MPTEAIVAKTNEIALGQYKAVKVAGKRLLICHSQVGFTAIDDTCTHDNGPLDEGELDGVEIECPRHGARFDVTTGKVLCLPAAIGIQTYSVTVDGEEIKVTV